MSRRIFIKKRFPSKDYIYDSFLVSLLVNKILKRGKKKLAKKIFVNTFNIILSKTKENPLKILEKAIRIVSPQIKLRPKRIGGSTYQVPTLLTKYQSTNIALKWILEISSKRNGKTMSIKLANEILDIIKGNGNTLKRKEETHKMAEANKAFLKLK